MSKPVQMGRNIIIELDDREIINIPKDVKRWKVKARAGGVPAIYLRYNNGTMAEHPLEPVDENSIQPSLDLYFGTNKRGKK